MAGNNTVSDVTLTGTVNTWMAGSTSDTGTVTLKVKGYGESRVDMQLAASGAIAQIRDFSLTISSMTPRTGPCLRSFARSSHMHVSINILNMMLTLSPSPFHGSPGRRFIRRDETTGAAVLMSQMNPAASSGQMSAANAGSSSLTAMFFSN